MPAGDCPDTPVTLWELIEPELAAFAMWSIYTGGAGREISHQAAACEDAGRLRDCAFWQATGAVLEESRLAEDALPADR